MIYITVSQEVLSNIQIFVIVMFISIFIDGLCRLFVVKFSILIHSVFEHINNRITYSTNCTTMLRCKAEEGDIIIFFVTLLHDMHQVYIAHTMRYTIII